MRSARARCVAALILAGMTLVSGTHLAAQDVHELERRVDALRDQRNAASAMLAAYRSRPVAARVFPDTVPMLDGAVRIVTDAEFRSLARDAAALVEPFMRERAGASIATLRGTVFALWTDSARRADHGVIVSPRINGREVDEHYELARATSLAASIETDFQKRLASSAKPNLERWSAGTLPLGPAANADWRAVRLQLVSSPTTIMRRCYAGALDACKAALGLTVEADPATAWFDSAGRRAIVAEAVAAYKEWRGDSQILSACASGKDSECIDLLRNSLTFAMWRNPPTSTLARATLVQEAIELGGAGVLPRLAASADAPAEALSAMAGVPIDSLVAHWQRRAHNGGIESESATPIVALTALVWFLLMAILSTRSPRWR